VDFKWYIRDLLKDPGIRSGKEENHERFEESQESKLVPPKNEAEVAAITLFLQLNV
jgi:hypothetical protein